MKRLLIIDGYNCIRRTGAFEADLDKSLESARAAFLECIRRYRVRKAVFERIVVVFDGTGNRGGSKVAQAGNTEVLFSRFGESADKAIELFLGKNSDHHEITVVSDDNYVTNHARVYGAKTLSCREFMRMMKNPDRTPASGPDEKVIDAKTADDITEELKKEWKIAD